MFLFCFVYVAKKEGFGQCPQFEFAADLSSKRRRISSPGDSDGNLPDAVHLQMSSRATSPHTGIACAADAPLADLPEVLHLTRITGK